MRIRPVGVPSLEASSEKDAAKRETVLAVLTEMARQPKGTSGAYLRALAYLWEHRENTGPESPLEQRLLEDLFGLDGRGMTLLRERVAYHSMNLAQSERADFYILIGTGLCTLNFIPVSASARSSFVNLDSLAEQERVGGGGHLEPTSHVLIYIHHGTGIAESLSKQMIVNMQAGVRYRYFIPKVYLEYVPQLLMEILRPVKDDLPSVLRVMRYRFEVNVMPVALPSLFSIHNSNKESSAVMYVRFLKGRRLIRYCVKAEAHGRAMSLLRDFPPIPRGSQSPLIARTGKSWRLSPEERVQLDEGISTALSDLDLDQKTIDFFIRRFVKGLTDRQFAAESKFVQSKKSQTRPSE